MLQIDRIVYLDADPVVLKDNNSIHLNVLDFILRGVEFEHYYEVPYKTTTQQFTISGGTKLRPIYGEYNL